MPNLTKTCKRCGKTKSIDCFTKETAKPDKLSLECRECHKLRYNKRSKEVSQVRLEDKFYDS